MELYQWICVIGIPSIISSICMLILNRGMVKRDKRQEEIQIQNAELEKQNRAIMAGVQAMLRDRLLNGYRHYTEIGYAGYDDRLNMENLYKQYHDLGENGIMDDFRERFRKLPLKQEDHEHDEQEEGTEEKRA